MTDKEHEQFERAATKLNRGREDLEERRAAERDDEPNPSPWRVVKRNGRAVR